MKAVKAIGWVAARPESMISPPLELPRYIEKSRRHEPIMTQEGYFLLKETIAGSTGRTLAGRRHDIMVFGSKGKCRLGRLSANIKYNGRHDTVALIRVGCPRL